MILVGLWRSRTGWQGTDRLVNRLIRLAFSGRRNCAFTEALDFIVYLSSLNFRQLRCEFLIWPWTYDDYHLTYVSTVRLASSPLWLPKAGLWETFGCTLHLTSRVIHTHPDHVSFFHPKTYVVGLLGKPLFLLPNDHPDQAELAVLNSRSLLRQMDGHNGPGNFVRFHIPNGRDLLWSNADWDIVVYRFFQASASHCSL